MCYHLLILANSSWKCQRVYCSSQSDNNKQISDSLFQQFRNVDAHVSSGMLLEQDTVEKLHENSPILCNSS